MKTQKSNIQLGLVALRRRGKKRGRGERRRIGGDLVQSFRSQKELVAQKRVTEDAQAW